MPTQIQEKVVDPEAELSNAIFVFKQLTANCGIDQRAKGEPTLAPQEKQLAILSGELKETKLCIKLATHGLHAIRDKNNKSGLLATIKELETKQAETRDNRGQLRELQLLNYLSEKNRIELLKLVPTEAEELTIIMNAQNRLRQFENRLELATKRFCSVNFDNACIRDEIRMLLAERKDFNNKWNRTINRLVQGKMFLMDIFETAAVAFGDRDEMCRKLEMMKWKGLQGLNKDIMEMQHVNAEMNHLSKLEEFLRVKGTKRICEADEKEELKRLEEIARCEREIAKLDALLNEIFRYTNSDSLQKIICQFKMAEVVNFNIFQLLCTVLQESIVTRKELEKWRHLIVDQREINKARSDKQVKDLEELQENLEKTRLHTDSLRQKNEEADALIRYVLEGVFELVRLADCDTSHLLDLLGPHNMVTKWNVEKFLRILEYDIKRFLELVYGQVGLPAPMPIPTPIEPVGKLAKGAKPKVVEAPPPPARVVVEPKLIPLKPNLVDRLVNYQPCAYCVEDYVMNQVLEHPPVPADAEYVDSMLHMDNPNTKFGIYTLTIPEKRHPFKAAK